MSDWHRYKKLRPARHLQYKGRELLGQTLHITVKRDGENVSLWIDYKISIWGKLYNRLFRKENKGNIRIASHNNRYADKGIVNRLKRTPEYTKIIDLIRTEKDRYNSSLIVYGELLMNVSPTRIEPLRKHIHWVLFDIYSLDSKRYISYNRLYQYAHDYKIPVVRVLEEVNLETMCQLEDVIDKWLYWCKHHRREGIVGKCYGNQMFFKERRNLPKRPKLDKISPDYPPMPHETVISALQHAYDEIGNDKKWKDKRIAMPIIARHISTEGREHYYTPPKNIYDIYLDTPLDVVKGNNNE